MKRIKNKRCLAIAIFMTVLAGACIIAYVVSQEETRFLIGCVLAIVYAGINYYSALSKKGVIEELEADADERDVFLAMKASQTSMQILNYLLLAACVVSLVMYSVTQNIICIALALAFCAVLVIAFIVLLCVNGYYERTK